MKDYIRVCDVEKYYGNASNVTKAIDRVSFTVAQGEFVGVMGASGSGKTTTLSLLEALDRPQKGTILYKGQDIRKIGEERYRRQHIGIVFQSFHLFPYLNVRENVEVSMEISGKTGGKRARAEELLRRVGLKETHYRQQVEKLSGGEQQRVAVARALAAEAEVILADEPTGNLDEETAAQIRELFRSMAHEMGKCVIVVTHSQEFAKGADTIIRLKNRKLITDRSGE